MPDYTRIIIRHDGVAIKAHPIWQQIMDLLFVEWPVSVVEIGKTEDPDTVYDEYHAARIAALKAALAPFAAAADRYDPGGSIGDSVQLWQDGRRIDFINVGHLRAARRAVSSTD